MVKKKQWQYINNSGIEVKIKVKGYFVKTEIAEFFKSDVVERSGDYSGDDTSDDNGKNECDSDFAE